jgi:hypothetical protein
MSLANGDEGFVCLTPDIWSWQANWIVQFENVYNIARDEAVLSYDVPDEVTAPT